MQNRERAISKNFRFIEASFHDSFIFTRIVWISNQCGYALKASPEGKISASRLRGATEGELRAERHGWLFGCNDFKSKIRIPLQSLRAICLQISSPRGTPLQRESFPMHVRFDQNSISFAARRGILSSFIMIKFNKLIFTRDHVDEKRIG